jgi:hypothetical protein
MICLRNPNRAGALANQFSANGPPKQVAGIHIGLPVRTIRTSHRDGPVQFDGFPRTKIAPREAVVPLIPVLVNYHGFPDLPRIQRDRRIVARRCGPPLRRDVLQDNVCNPGFRVVVEAGTAIVNSTLVSVWIDSCEQLAEMAPILLLPEDIKLVCQRPPDIPKSRESGYNVLQVGFVVPLIHGRESPCVVGVKQNDVGFDARACRSRMRSS